MTNHIRNIKAPSPPHVGGYVWYMEREITTAGREPCRVWYAVILSKRQLHKRQSAAARLRRARREFREYLVRSRNV